MELSLVDSRLASPNNAHSFQLPLENVSANGIVIPKKIFWDGLEGEGFPGFAVLSRQPWMSGEVEVEYTTTVMCENDRHE